jgi:hypothetical protein
VLSELDYDEAGIEELLAAGAATEG